MLMLLDRPPDPERLRAAVWRAARAVPRLCQRIVDAPFDLALPRWEPDPTFDLDYHLRRYSLHAGVGSEEELAELFHSVGPIYERPFDRTRPLWEIIEIDRPEDRSALFCRLHHSIADGVGANAVLAALTDAEREGEPAPPPDAKPPGAWPEPRFVPRLMQAIRDRASDDFGRARSASQAALDMARRPKRLIDFMRGGLALSNAMLVPSTSHLQSYGRVRRLSGLSIPFEPLRETRRRLGGRTVDLLLTGVAGAMGEWHRRAGHHDVDTLMTTLPINLRPRSEQGLAAEVGNQLTALLLRLPIGERDPRRRFRQIHRLVEEGKAHPATEVFPFASHMLAVLPRALHRSVSLLSMGAVDLIVSNIPGVPVARYVAGAEITAAYPIAPTVPHCPVSIALYGYRNQLFIGLDADGTVMPELDEFSSLLEASFAELASLDV
jgi:WS/DGAT/MGAT family acyltransferase